MPSHQEGQKSLHSTTRWEGSPKLWVRKKRVLPTDSRRGARTGSKAPEVVQVGDLLHAQPAELTAAHRTRHVVAAPVVHLDDVGTAARARLDVVCCGGRGHGVEVCEHGGFPFYAQSLCFGSPLLAQRVGMVQPVGCALGFSLL